MGNVIKSSEFYIGAADVIKLGNTDKIGIFIKFELESLVQKIQDNFELFMESLEDQNIADISPTLHIKILPLKSENILDNKTHSVKTWIQLTDTTTTDI